MTVLILKYQGSNDEGLTPIEYSSSVDLTFELLISNQVENYNGMKLEINCGELFSHSKALSSFIRKLRSEGKYNYNYNSRPRTSFVPFKVNNVYQFTFANDVLKVEEKEGEHYLEVKDISLLEKVEEVKNFSLEEFKKRWDLSVERISLGKEVMRIKGMLGGDLSDGRLQKLVDDERLLPEVQRENFTIRNQLTTANDTITNLQTQLTQTQSERDDYQNKYDGSEEELRQKNEINKQLIEKLRIDHEEFDKALTKSKEWHERQKKDNLDFLLEIRNKEKELKELKKSAKIKLNDEQKFLISTLLISQEQVIRLQSNSHLVSLNEKQLNKVKKNLNDKLTSDEINKLCQLQTEITKLEMKLEQMKEELQARIEININN
jgi:hypothetical protein